MTEQSDSRDGGLRDRVTRLEALREADREKMVDIMTTMHSINAKIDVLSAQLSQSAGSRAFITGLFDGAGPVLWATLVALALWIARAAITGKVGF